MVIWSMKLFDAARQPAPQITLPRSPRNRCWRKNERGGGNQPHSVLGSAMHGRGGAPGAPRCPRCPGGRGSRGREGTALCPSHRPARTAPERGRGAGKEKFPGGCEAPRPPRRAAIGRAACRSPEPQKALLSGCLFFPPLLFFFPAPPPLFFLPPPAPSLLLRCSRAAPAAAAAPPRSAPRGRQRGSGAEPSRPAMA